MQGVDLQAQVLYIDTERRRELDRRITIASYIPKYLTYLIVQRALWASEPIHQETTRKLEARR